MKELSKAARWHDVGEDEAGQRIDNYLTRLLKGVPKSHLYRIVRGGMNLNANRPMPD